MEPKPEAAAVDESFMATIEQKQTLLRPLSEEVKQLFVPLAALTEKESWEKKERFPSHLRQPLFECAKMALMARLTGYMIDDNFFEHLQIILPYNMFTLKKLIYKNILPDWIQELESQRNKMMTLFHIRIRTNSRLRELATSNVDVTTSHQHSADECYFMWTQHIRLLLWEIMEKFMEVRAAGCELHLIDAAAFPKQETELETREKAYVKGWATLEEIADQYSQLKEKIGKQEEEDIDKPEKERTSKQDKEKISKQEKKRQKPEQEQQLKIATYQQQKTQSIAIDSIVESSESRNETSAEVKAETEPGLRMDPSSYQLLGPDRSPRFAERQHLHAAAVATPGIGVASISTPEVVDNRGRRGSAPNSQQSFFEHPIPHRGSALVLHHPSHASSQHRVHPYHHPAHRHPPPPHHLQVQQHPFSLAAHHRPQYPVAGPSVPNTVPPPFLRHGSDISSSKSLPVSPMSPESGHGGPHRAGTSSIRMAKRTRDGVYPGGQYDILTTRPLHSFAPTSALPPPSSTSAVQPLTTNPLTHNVIYDQLLKQQGGPTKRIGSRRHSENDYGFGPFPYRYTSGNPGPPSGYTSHPGHPSVLPLQPLPQQPHQSRAYIHLSVQHHHQQQQQQPIRYQTEQYVGKDQYERSYPAPQRPANQYQQQDQQRHGDAAMSKALKVRAERHAPEEQMSLGLLSDAQRPEWERHLERLYRRQQQQQQYRRDASPSVRRPSDDQGLFQGQSLLLPDSPKTPARSLEKPSNSDQTASISSQSAHVLEDDTPESTEQIPENRVRPDQEAMKTMQQNAQQSPKVHQSPFQLSALDRQQGKQEQQHGHSENEEETEPQDTAGLELRTEKGQEEEVDELDSSEDDGSQEKTVKGSSEIAHVIVSDVAETDELQEGEVDSRPHEDIKVFKEVAAEIEEIKAMAEQEAADLAVADQGEGQEEEQGRMDARELQALEEQERQVDEQMQQLWEKRKALQQARESKQRDQQNGEQPSLEARRRSSATTTTSATEREASSLTESEADAAAP
ncbi:hypothetical protein EDD11_001490 [Mortierella claussenii]|nr:hypothetical protein EDD11_001490 [Mortierella claussenii]